MVNEVKRRVLLSKRGTLVDLRKDCVAWYVGSLSHKQGCPAVGYERLIKCKCPVIICDVGFQCPVCTAEVLISVDPREEESLHLHRGSNGNFSIRGGMFECLGCSTLWSIEKGWATGIPRP